MIHKLEISLYNYLQIMIFLKKIFINKADVRVQLLLLINTQNKKEEILGWSIIIKGLMITLT